jgi:2'-5' RNA ligase
VGAGEHWSNRPVLTLGVAIPVPAPWAEELVDWRRRVGDPAAARVPPHVTLLPPIQVPAAAMPEIEAHLAATATAFPPFEMHLSGTGTFAPVSDVVFVAVARGIGNCELIANDVRSGPLTRSLSFPYHPHVTVAHDVPADMLELAYSGLAELSAEFRVTSFTEYERTADGVWTVARDYPLTGLPHRR